MNDVHRSAGAAAGAGSAFLAGGGQLGELLRTRDWSRTALGAPERWPQSLKTAIRIMLTSRQPIWVGWGRDLAFFYNDAYLPIIGGRHPWALGLPTAQVWPELWHEIGPMLAQAMGGVEGTYVEDQLLIMERHGYREETYYTFSYSPIPDDDGTPGGIICANRDETRRVIGERQLALLRDLAAATADARSRQAVYERAGAALAGNPKDLPFALVYRADAQAGALMLATSAGIAVDHPAAPVLLPFGSTSPWPVAPVLNGHDMQLVDLRERFGNNLPTGAWNEPPVHAAVYQIATSGDTGPPGALVVGLNPLRLFDDSYRDFLGLVAAQVGSALAGADAYEHERRRAESLAELDRAKTAFFSNISHEFRTPLTLMLGPLEEALAADTQMRPGERERVRLVHRNTLRLLKLVNALLDFSRIEAGRMAARFQATDLAAFTADLASTFRAAIERAGLALRIDCPPLAAPAAVDRDMWEKIVLNLLSNAFKFTFDGEIEVALRERGDAEIELEIRDTGTGIPAHEVPHLFERFRRIEGARGRSFEGSGIGLALVRELVELHGGRIAVASEVGRGTTFAVTLPRRTGAGGAAAQVQPAPATSTPRAQAFVEEATRWLPGDGADEHDEAGVIAAAELGSAATRSFVLVADDNADMRGYVCRLLGARHECETAEDGEAALARMRERRPDLLLTDIMMPRMDGFALLAAIRADPALRDLPVIVLSARAGEEARVEGLHAGADDYLVKPFAARELIARVDGALALARMRHDMGEALREEAHSLEILNRTGAALAGELDLKRAVQLVTDAATELTGAAFGAFFYNVRDADGESYMLYTLSGVPREAFAKFPMPRNTEVFGPTFVGAEIVRSDDITADPRYGRNAPHHGMPEGHLPVRSYLAAPVVSRSGEVLGGLFFGHPQPGMFGARDERLLHGIAAQAAIAIDNARLFQSAQDEIEQRRRTEAALRESEERQHRLNASLEAIVAARTQELLAANEQLRIEAAERAKAELALRRAQKIEALGKLTGGVAHDFNNLLQVIGGNLQLLSRHVAGSEKGEERLRNALAGVARGSRLAAQLLAFGRRQPLAPKVVNLGRLVRNLDDLLRRTLGDGVQVETIIAAGLWNTLVDPSQVENALLNLAINARDAMGGHGTLTIETGNAALTDDYVAGHAEIDPGQYVMLAVTDSGCGMTPDVIEQVFEPFFTTKPEGQGTGLGLSMVYGFVKQSGGHIAIYSEPGHGTTVRIYLPRVMQDEDVATEVEPGPLVGGTETVLVVEDDDDVRQTVVDLLLELGYHVLKARDASSALAIIESGAPIDLLFTDVVMPGRMRSPELARAARERLPRIAVLFTSGYTDNAIVHGGRVDPGIELLSKPYTREALARKFRQVLRNQQQRNMLAGAGPILPSPDPDGPGRAPLTVLLVEDDLLVQTTTAELLAEFGHRVLRAANGAEALALLDATTVDVLMTDVNLPGMNGGALAAEVRRRQPQARVIFATGEAARPDDLGADALSASVLLRKPYDANALLDALAAAVA